MKTEQNQRKYGARMEIRRLGHVNPLFSLGEWRINAGDTTLSTSESSFTSLKG